MINKDLRRHSIRNIIKYIHEAEDAKTISYYENAMISTYTTSLLYLAAIAYFVVHYSAKSQNLGAYLLDSLIFLLIAVAFEVIIRVALKINIVTLIVSGLSALTFLFIMVRFYDTIGAPLWIVAFLQLMLAMMRITRTMLYTLIFTYLLSGSYIIFLRPIQMDNLYYVIQIPLFLVLCIISAAVHKVNRDRYYRNNKNLREVMEKKEEITALYEQIAASEEEAQATLDKLRKTQEQLIQQEKLAGIGQLAAGVAHEINNPLGYISSNFETSREYFKNYKNLLQTYQRFIELLPQKPPEKFAATVLEIKELEEKNKLDFISSDLEELFDDIEDGLKRISEIVLGLKTFSRVEQNEQFDDYDLNEGIKNTLLIARNEIKHHARVVEILADIPIIKAKGSQINQVLLNIILNAVHAVKDKKRNNIGSIMVSTEKLNGYVRCQIEDNGTGIEEKNLTRIFDPFFTTKPIGQGTGLGLSIAYDIVVNKHGGEIFVESKPGISTKFIIKLPVQQLGIKIGEKI